MERREHERERGEDEGGQKERVSKERREEQVIKMEAVKYGVTHSVAMVILLCACSAERGSFSTIARTRSSSDFSSH